MVTAAAQAYGLHPARRGLEGVAFIERQILKIASWPRLGQVTSSRVYPVLRSTVVIGLLDIGRSSGAASWGRSAGMRHSGFAN